MKNTPANRIFVLIKIHRGEDLGNDPRVKGLFKTMKKRGLCDGNLTDGGILNAEVTEKGEALLEEHEKQHPLTELLENKIMLLVASVVLALIGGFASGVGEAVGMFLLSGQ